MERDRGKVFLSCFLMNRQSDAMRRKMILFVMKSEIYKIITRWQNYFIANIQNVVPTCTVHSITDYAKLISS